MNKETNSNMKWCNKCSEHTLDNLEDDCLNCGLSRVDDDDSCATREKND